MLRKLQREVFVLSLAESLDTAPELDGFGAELIEECEMEVEMGPSQNLNDLFGELNKRGITVVSLRNKANRLEELFVSLTANREDGQ